MRRRDWAREDPEHRHPDDYQPDMPPLRSAEYLLGYLWEMGPTVAAGMGVGPITFGEMLAWQQLTGVRLAAWEARFVRRLSLEYLSESNKATKIDAPPPWVPPDVKAKPLPSAAQLALRALALQK